MFVPQYLGSMLVKELRGTESTHDACAKMRVRVVSPWQPLNNASSYAPAALKSLWHTVIEKTGNVSFFEDCENTRRTLDLITVQSYFPHCMSALTSFYLEIPSLTSTAPGPPFSWDYLTRQDSSPALFLCACKTPSVLSLFCSPPHISSRPREFETCHPLILHKHINTFRGCKFRPSISLFVLSRIFWQVQSGREPPMHRKSLTVRARGEMRSRWIYIPLTADMTA